MLQKRQMVLTCCCMLSSCDCARAEPPTNCSGLPTAPLTNGSWPGSCAGSLIGQTCSAACTLGGSANVTCLQSGQWEAAVTGACTGETLQFLSKWPGSGVETVPGAASGRVSECADVSMSACAGIGHGDSQPHHTQSFFCSPRHVFVFNDCLCTAAAPTNCSGTPSVKPDYGSWPAACSGTLVGSSCSAACTYGGTVAAACSANGTWSTAKGACTRESQAVLWHVAEGVANLQ